jgi:uncharacterized membrane protein YccC
MSQNTLSEFNRLLHGVDLSEEDIEYENKRIEEEKELFLDYTKLFEEEKKEEIERISKLENLLRQLTQTLTVQDQKLTEQEEQIKQLLKVRENPPVSASRCCVIS